MSDAKHSNPDSKQSIKTSVRNLVEFVLKEGDLRASFQGPDRALAGTKGHLQVQQSRPDDYEAEVSINHRVERENLQLEIFGRIDGVFATKRPVVIEEIKTTRHELALIDEAHNPLHWAQAKCYAAIFAIQQGLSEIVIQLTYYQIETREQRSLFRLFTIAELTAFFDDLVQAYLDWARKVIAWTEARTQSIHALDFPYTHYRQGQRDMAVAVYKSIRAQEKLFVQAPTGVGKTIAALFPAVKAIGMGLVSKLFYLTAKTPGRAVAEKAVEDMRAAGLRFKCVTLTAKEKICFCPDAVNDPEQCQFSRNYFGKVKQALAEAYQHEALTRDVVEAVARRHEVCPFEFSLDLALWADGVICDYNYAFDPRVYLRRFFEQNTESYVFLVDEAHNLPDRAREMFSAELDKQTVLDLRRELKPHLPQLANPLTAVNQALLEKRKRCQSTNRQAVVEHEPPEALLDSLHRFIHQAEDWLVLNQETPFRAGLLDFYFQCQNYVRTAEKFDYFYVSYFERSGRSNLRAKLFCLDPAPLLAEALKRSRSTVFFSATLWPMTYFQQILTGSSDHGWLALPSPFPQDNFNLLIHNRISTKYTQRPHSYQPIAATIETVCSARIGNYLIFFPSYAYMEAVVELVRDRLPGHRLLVQDRGMAERDRDAFLAQFSASNQETLIGFVVMGGIFGEGIDLVGDRLIGAVVIGVGLPQLGLERDLIKTHFSRQSNKGFEYAYQYPGLNRVMQAAGRVIRSETDRGVILLIDDRFMQHRYRVLFPRQWKQFDIVQNSEDLKQKLAYFWQETEEKIVPNSFPIER